MGCVYMGLTLVLLKSADPRRDGKLGFTPLNNDWKVILEEQIQIAQKFRILVEV